MHTQPLQPARRLKGILAKICSHHPSRVGISLSWTRAVVTPLPSARTIMRETRDQRPPWSLCRKVRGRVRASPRHRGTVRSVRDNADWTTCADLRMSSAGSRRCPPLCGTLAARVSRWCSRAKGGPDATALPTPSPCWRPPPPAGTVYVGRSRKDWPRPLGQSVSAPTHAPALEECSVGRGRGAAVRGCVCRRCGLPGAGPRGVTWQKPVVLVPARRAVPRGRAAGVGEQPLPTP